MHLTIQNFWVRSTKMSGGVQSRIADSTETWVVFWRATWEQGWQMKLQVIASSSRLGDRRENKQSSTCYQRTASKSIIPATAQLILLSSAIVGQGWLRWLCCRNILHQQTRLWVAHCFTSHTKTVVGDMPNISRLAPTLLQSQSLDGVDYLHICFPFPKDSTNQHLSSCKSEEWRYII